MKKKILLITSIVSIILLSLISISFAATGDIELTASNKKVKRGETFTITMKVTSEDGINGIMADYSYDDTYLELQGKKVKDNWQDFSSDNSLAFMTNSESKITEVDILELTFKVKETAKIGNTTQIKLTDATIDTDLSEDSKVDISDKTILITIDENTSGKDEENQQSGNNAEKLPDNITNNNVAADVPKTGATSTTMAIITLIGIATFSFVSYLRYKNV